MTILENRTKKLANKKKYFKIINNTTSSYK